MKMNGVFTKAVAWVLLAVCAVYAGSAAAVETVVYYHNDALGSPVAATDPQGEVLWREAYSPYGDRLRKEDGGSNSLWYTAKPHEADFDLTYSGARWYMPATGRFTDVDPVGFQEDHLHSFNRYIYANNNPYKYVDPDGEFPILPIPLVMGLEALNLGLEVHDTVTNPCNGCVRSSGAIFSGGFGLGAGKALSKGFTKNGGDFFEGTKYTEKVKRQMQQGDFHSFPESVKVFQDAGKVTKLKGGDGVTRDKLEIPGGYRGREGNFEFIKDPGGAINHRLFNPVKE